MVAVPGRTRSQGALLTKYPIYPDERGGEQDVPMDPRALRRLDSQSASNGWTCPQPLLPN